MIVQVRELSVWRGGAQILHDIELAIEAGEILVIVGPNGSGKSTLLGAMVGAIAPSAGRIVKQPGLRIGYAPQRLSIDPTLPLSVERFLRLPGGWSGEDVARALDAVEARALRDRPMNALSGGQFQRALLARAMLGAPDLLLLDEPTQALDQPGAARFYRMIEERRDRTGCAVVLVSHDLHVVMSAADRVICINGHICCQGAPRVVAEAPEYRALFGAGTGGALALYRHAHDHRHDDIGEDGGARR